MHRAKRPGRIVPSDMGVGAMRVQRPVNVRCAAPHHSNLFLFLLYCGACVQPSPSLVSLFSCQARMMSGTAQGPYSGGYGAGPQAYGAIGGGMASTQAYGGMDGMGGHQGSYAGYSAPSHDMYGGYASAVQQAAYGQASPQVAQPVPAQDAGPVPAGWSYTVLRLRGMPFNANEQHIVVSHQRRQVLVSFLGRRI